MQRSTPNDAGVLPSCTVIVCTRERPQQLERCLASLLTLINPRVALHVVENGTHPTCEKLASRFGARYDFLERPGLSHARNFAARLATTDLVAFIDDDAVADAQWLSAAIPEFLDERVGLVTGPVLSMGERTHFRALGEERFVVDRTSPYWFQRANFGGIGHGGNLVIRRSTFHDWSGFHERLGRGVALSGGEDSFAIYELLSRGWRVVYVPTAVVVHEEPLGSAAKEKARATARNSVAYLLFLFVTARAHRGKLLQYVAGGIQGKRRSWRGPIHSPSPISPWDRFFSRLRGVSTFWRTCFGRDR